MITWLKRLFCKHKNLVFIRTLYGDEVIEYGWKRSAWKCTDCNAIVFKDKLK